MTEAQENRMRNELAQFREEHPEEFVNLMLECLAARVEDNSVTALRRKDADDIPDCLIVFFKGYAVAQHAEQAVESLRRKMEEEDDGPADREDGDVE